MSALPRPQYSLFQLLGYFLRLGTFGFGGPVALVGFMHRDLVEQRHWISEADYKEGLALAQIAPGPLAAQLAMYLGFVHYRVPGATVAGFAFVLPSFLMVVALGRAYRDYGGLPWMQAVFYGVGAAVIGIMAIGTHKLAVRNIGSSRLLWSIFAVLAAVTIGTQSEITVLFIAAGLLVWLVRCRPAAGGRLSAVLLPAPLVLAPLAGDADLLLRLGLFFAKAGAFVFGSGLAIVPFLYAGTVTEYHWLTDRQFVDAVAVAMITPGPVVITTGFIGYLVGGLPGACVAAAATFLPCYLITILAAPQFKKHGKRPAIVAFVDGITAAAIGAIAGSVVVLGMRAITDATTAILAVASAALLWKFRKLPEPLLVLGAALVSVAMHPAPGRAAESASTAMVPVAEVALPGDTSRFDYASLDPQVHRLYIAHLGASEVLVVDTLSRKVVGRVPGLRLVHGVLAVPSLGRVYASATGSGEIVAIDARSLAIVARMPGGIYPDGLAYAPTVRKLYVSDEHGDSETVIDVDQNRRIATIPLGGEAGNTQFDPGSGHILVNVQSRGELVEIDPGADRVIARHALPGARGNHGLQVLASQGLAAIADEDDGRLRLFDLRTHAVLQELEVGDGPDVLAYDDSRALLVVASESGVVSLFRLSGRSLVRLSDSMPGRNAHVVAVDAASHLAYFPIADLGGSPALRILALPR